MILLALVNVYFSVIAFLHLFVFWLACDAVCAILRVIRRRDFGKYVAGGAALLLCAVYLSAGWFFAHHVFEVGYELETGKVLPEGSLRVVLIADAHMGATLDGEDFDEEMERIEAAGPDIVVVTGDFVDDESSVLDMLAACRALGGLDTTYGVYFVFGNHDKGYFDDREFSEKELRDALESNDVVILEDEVNLIADSVYIIGRQDRSVRDRAEIVALTDGLDRSKYMIVLDHQPNDYAAEAEAEVDLVLSGHTHGGHVFPAGQLGMLMGANDALYGHEQRGGTDFIVTSGISGWAIPFKMGAISEYVVIDIKTK